MYTNKQRKHLVNQINALSFTEHEEIYKIIQKHGLTYSQNKNGIFFNISTFPDEVVDEIHKLVSFCMSQQHDLDEYDQKINECKMNNNVQRMDIKKHFEHNAQHQKQQIEHIHEKLDEASMEKLTNFIEKIKQDRDKIGKKKTNTSFLNFKKRFLKKSGERKIEKDLENELKAESFLINTSIHT